jgi:hypothetical protein
MHAALIIGNFLSFYEIDSVMKWEQLTEVISLPGVVMATFLSLNQYELWRAIINPIQSRN